MIVIHEVWQEPSTGNCMVCLAGPAGDKARSLLAEGSRKIHTIEASSNLEAMTKYYEYQGWGEYTTECEQDKHSYINKYGDVSNAQK